MGAYRELLAQAKKGNHPAIEKLYERYYTLLRSYSFVNGRFDEDLLQVQVIEFLIAVSKFRM
jgi:DNA-directed RNA polymerase specialized sigma subunit